MLVLCTRKLHAYLGLHLCTVTLCWTQLEVAFGINIAAARAVDREFNYKFGSDLGAGEARGLRPPAPPCFLGGSAPPDPPKGAPRPWLQRLFAFSRPNHLSGAELFPRNPTCSQQATCPGQLRCPGQNLFPQFRLFFLKKQLVQGSFAAWGRTFSQKSFF